MKQFCNIPEKQFALLRLLCLFIKSPFVDNALTFSDSSFNSFSTSTCFVLFEIRFLFNFFSLSSKSFFFIKPAISVLLPTFACFHLAVKGSAVNLLNY